jgi:protein-tyrosine phosphatase
VVDLHTHVLPGIDDGPPDLEGSLRLCRRLAAEGVRTAAATPHCRSDHPTVVPAELAERCRTLNGALADDGVELDVAPAGEVDLVWGLEASDEELRLVSYGQRGNTLLVETPYGPLPSSFEELLFQLTLKGFRLLLAHPERNPTFQSDLERLGELVRRGTLVQVTASSLVRSPKGSRSASTAHRIVEEGLAHVIASDAHGPAAPDRASLADGAAAAERLVGAERARWLVEDAPGAVLAGEELPPQPAAVPPKRGLRSRLGL